MRLRAIAQNGNQRDSRAEALSTLPPSQTQKRFALACLSLFAAFCATVPFATVPLPYFREFIPAYATAMFVISSITSALLFVQFSLVHSRALLAISGGYLLSALLTVPWALTFPDLLGETDMTSTTWGLLSRIWHLVFPLSFIGYTLLKDEDALEGPSSVVISVTDTGEGIDPNIVDRIFNPLFTTKSNGMGMGLAICRSIIEGHEGRFSASVGAQGGAVFQFVLPGDGA